MWESIRYYLALVIVVTWPPALLFWFMIHPFVAFWQRLGPWVTYTIVFSIMAGGLGGGIFFLRGVSSLGGCNDIPFFFCRAVFSSCLPGGGFFAAEHATLLLLL